MRPPLRSPYGPFLPQLPTVGAAAAVGIRPTQRRERVTKTTTIAASREREKLTGIDVAQCSAIVKEESPLYFHTPASLSTAASILAKEKKQDGHRYKVRRSRIGWTDRVNYGNFPCECEAAESGAEAALKFA